MKNTPRVSSASTLCASLPWATPLALDVATADPTALEVAVAVHDLVFSLVPYMHHAARRWNKPESDASVRVLTADDFTIPTRTYGYGATTSLTMSFPSAAYRPAFKVNPHILPSELEISVERRVERTSDELSNTRLRGQPPRVQVLLVPARRAPRVLNSASFLANGAVTHVAGADLMASAQLCAITLFAPALEVFPNRDSVPFHAFYRIPEAHTTRWLAADVKEWLVDGLEWREATQRAVGASASDEDALVATDILRIHAVSATYPQIIIPLKLRWWKARWHG
ncbi:hypothetical protein B0H14DRAFT_3788115 [Mycena olivaceomarginata]|nr:hypothetical protein B0H14DRAFT_3788115 [Mycena olivaceomarginata]